MKRLFPMRVQAPTFFCAICMQCVDLPMQEQLLGRQISYSSYICNLNAYLTALRNATTDHIESAQGARLLPSISRLCVFVLLLLNKDFFTAKRFEYFPARQQVLKISRHNATWLSSCRSLANLSRTYRPKSPHLIPTPRSPPLVNFFSALARKGIELSLFCF